MYVYCNFDQAELCFFRAFNAIYGKVGRLASQQVILGLLRTKCLPVLLYATEACPLLSRNKQSFEFTVTRIFMKVFHTGSSTVVRECQFNLTFCPLQHRSIYVLQDFCRSLMHLKTVCICCLQLTLHVS